MRIIVKSPNEKPIRIILPTRLVFNKLTARIGAGAINKYIPSKKFKINSHDLHRFMKGINRIKHKYPGLVLVDAESSDGEKLQIRL